MSFRPDGSHGVCHALAASVQSKGSPHPRTERAEVGSKAGFTLKDQRGKICSLDEYLKKGKVALVFYRSADW